MRKENETQMREVLDMIGISEEVLIVNPQKTEFGCFQAKTYLRNKVAGSIEIYETGIVATIPWEMLADKNWPDLKERCGR